MTFTTTTVPDHDDDRHQLEEGPHARESIVLLFQIPEENIAAGVYTWVNAAGEAGWSTAIFNAWPDGRSLHAGDDGIPVGDMPFSDWRLGPVTWQNLEPLRSGRVSYTGDDAALDVTYEAMHEPYLYSSAQAGCPQFVATDRLEQSCRVRGTLRVGDREIAVDTMGHRDHSWGTRDWKMMQHYKWIEAQTADAAVHVFEITAKSTVTTYGYVFKDGQLSPVASAVFDIDFDDRMVEETVDIAIVDEQGRETTLSGTRFAEAELPVSPHATLVDICMAVEIDGVAGVGYADLSWPPDYLEHMRTYG